MHNPLIEKTNEIISSKLLAKAVLEKDGRVHIVAVFEKSSEHLFFFHFTAKSKCSPRKSWKFDFQWYGLYGGMQTGNHKDIESFIRSHYPGIEFKVIYPRPIKKRDYQIWHTRKANPFNDFTKAVPQPGQTTKYAAAVTSGHGMTSAIRKSIQKFN